jgi:ABC-type transporter MlaC component
MAMRSLPADYLPHMTNSQKEEFTDIFSRLLVQGYSRRLDRYAKISKSRLVFDEGQIEGGDAFIKSRLITSKKEHVITYRLHQVGEKWLIYDVGYDGLSQVDSNRAQLDRIGKKSAYDYQEVRKRIQERLKPALRNLPVPQVKMRLWGVCQ